jgi:hypothetical protein
MKTNIEVHLKNGNYLSSKFYEITFHGLSLHGRVEQFLYEKGVLEFQDKEDSNVCYYFPFESIEHIEERKIK